MLDVHAYLADLIRRSQAAGGILPERDADAEAWVSLSIGLLRMIDVRLGGLVERDGPRIAAGRTAWLTGREPGPSC